MGKGYYHGKICGSSVCPSGHGKIFARVSGDIAALKEAKSYEEFKNAYMDFVEADTELETAKTVAHIRNTINL